MDTEPYIKYLNILGLQKKAPSLGFLSTLVNKHLHCFPYENVSKLLQYASGSASLPSLEKYLENNLKYKFGGTCYPQNIYFHQLISHLGFQSKLVDAHLNGQGGKHISIQVLIEGKNYIVDFGFMDAFCGPFLLGGKDVEEWINGRQFKFISKKKWGVSHRNPQRQYLSAPFCKQRGCRKLQSA